MVVVVANLPVRKMLGQASQGMLLCASNSDHTVVEPLLPPSEAPPGERIFWGPEGRGQSEAATPNQVTSNCSPWKVEYPYSMGPKLAFVSSMTAFEAQYTCESGQTA